MQSICSPANFVALWLKLRIASVSLLQFVNDSVVRMSDVETIYRQITPFQEEPQAQGARGKRMKSMKMQTKMTSHQQYWKQI